MKKINFNDLEQIQGGGVGASCYFSSMMAVAGLVISNFALTEVGATTFYACVRYL